MIIMRLLVIILRLQIGIELIPPIPMYMVTDCIRTIGSDFPDIQSMHMKHSFFIMVLILSEPIVSLIVELADSSIELYVVTFPQLFNHNLVPFETEQVESQNDIRFTLREVLLCGMHISRIHLQKDLSLVH